MQPFQAESKRLLDLMINSIYTHKEIFLRELISNASDAIDKLYYRELDEGTTGIAREDYAISLAVDQAARTITISDNGVGMTREELEKNLGIIANSGTLRFREAQENPEVESIGQFGVGFYSSFMVAAQVRVVSKLFDAAEAYAWYSEGADGFTISAAEKDSHGTDIILTLKDDTDDERYSEFLDSYRLQSLIKKYSDYIRYPIRMELQKSRMKERPAGEAEENTSPEYESYTEIDTINSMVPLWRRSKADITQEMYEQFYQDKFMDYEKPLKVVHVNAEGTVSYHALLYFPARAPYDYYSKEFQKGLQLYSSGVLIMDKCEDLLPDCFSFVRGLVDSPDLSLNISREILQHDRQLKVIAANIEKKIKNELSGMLATDRETYETLYKAFGLQLKFGAYANFGQQKELLQDLLLFHSMNENKLITLREYRDKIPDAQNAVYYASGETTARINQLPQLDSIRDRGYDVLFLTEDVDEFVMRVLMEYDGKPFQSIAGGDLDLGGEEEKKAVQEQSEAHKDLLTALSEALSGKIKEARISTRLKKHAVCLTSDGALTIEMERILNAMPQGNGSVKAERVLELNAEHPVFEKLTALYESDREKLAAYAGILYAQAQLMEGMLPDDPAAYVEAVMELMG